MKKENFFEEAFNRSITAKSECINAGTHSLNEIGNEIVNSLRLGGKLMLCGNGGSAADSQHLAAELLIRLRPHVNRQPIPAIALAMDISTLTACGNDYGFDEIFSRNLMALGKKGDCLLGITTSGNSKNVVKAMELAKKMGIKVFGFLGGDGGQCHNLCDQKFIVPTSNTANIQECHITAGHALMEYIENNFIEELNCNDQ